MHLINFGGGLNTRLSPQLIGINESVLNTNVDVTANNLKPLKGHVATPENFGANGGFTYFNGQWISNTLATSFVEFNNNLYYSTGVGKLQKVVGTTTYNVGLDKPPNTLTTTANEVGFTIADETETQTEVTLEEGNTQYFIMYYVGANLFGTKSQVHDYQGSNGVKVDITIPTGVNKVLLYREYEGTYRLLKEFVADGSFVDKTLDIEENATVEYISFKDDTAVRQYCYTYYRNDDGSESASTSFSEDLEYLGGTVTVTGFTAPTDNSVTHIRLYRLGGALDSMFLVAELPTNATEYLDDKLDSDIAETPLGTLGTTPPPENLNFLTENNATLFGALGSSLYFSQSGLVDLWNSFNFIRFPETITGLGSTQNGLLVFTRNKTFIIAGTDASNFVKFPLHSSQGCISHNTISYIDNTLIWLSLDGVCISRGSDIEIITLPKLGLLNLSPRKSAIYERQYFLFHDTGTLVVDFRFGLVFRNLDLIAVGAYYSPQFDKLYFINPDDTGVYEWGTGTNDLTYSYKTGWLAEQGITETKLYNNLYVYATGANTLKFYIDGNLVQTKTLNEGFTEIQLPQTRQRGYYSEIELTGTGVVYEIEFKTDGRTNGR